MQWYEKHLRRNLVDMHIEDWDERFLSQFDPDRYVECLKLGHINAPMLYLQSHVGLCYWPTQSGKMHAGFRGREDSMRKVERLCHQAGMSVIAYYSLIYNNWAYERYPKWRMRDVTGKSSRAEGGRYGLCCPNNLEYRAFLDAQIRELCDYFDFEGIFLDMTFWPMVCYCDACRARWSAEVNGEMPETVDWKDSRWRTFQQKRSDWLGEFAEYATGLVERYKPGCAVEHQYSTIMQYWRFGVNENMTRASTYAGGDLYGGIAQQSLACKLYYGITRAQPFEYMTSRCYPALSEHTTTKSVDLIKLSVMMTYLHHGACLLIDAIDPVGTMDIRVYERIGEVLRHLEPYEKYLTWGRPAYDVALYYNLEGKYDPNGAPYPVNDAPVHNARFPMQDALMGAARSLRQHHIPYGVVSNWNFEAADKGRVLVVTDAPFINAHDEERMLDFVRGGGRLYMSGNASPALLSEIFGLKVEGYTQERVTYISPTPSGEALMKNAYTREYPLAMFEAMPLASGEPKGEVLGTLTLPYTLTHPVPIADREDRLDDEPNHPFASIHSNPPGKFTNIPALVRARYGLGEAVWCAAPIEKPEREQHSDIFANLISMLCEGRFAFSLRAPEVVECVLFDAPEHHAKLVGLINAQESFHTLPVYEIDVRVESDRCPASVTRISDGAPIDFEYSGGSVRFQIKKMELYEMMLIQFVP